MAPSSENEVPPRLIKCEAHRARQIRKRSPGFASPAKLTIEHTLRDGSPIPTSQYGSPVKRKDYIAYKFSVQLEDGYTEQKIQTYICDNVVDRAAVPLPQGWDVALSASVLRDIELSATTRAASMAPPLGVKAAILGAPRHIEPPVDGEQVGAVVLLGVADDAPVAYVLCAHVGGHLWYCHGGNFHDATLDEADPFPTEGLIIKDVAEWAHHGNTALKAQRVGRHSKLGQLRAAVLKNAVAFDAAAAYAGFLTEEARAAAAGEQLNVREIASSFEPNPWRFHVPPGGWKSQCKIGVLWTWLGQERGGDSETLPCHSFFWCHLNKIMQKKQQSRGIAIPVPSIFEDLQLQQRLEGLSRPGLSQYYVPCKFLGVHIGSGDAGAAPHSEFQPDPYLWPRQALGPDGWKSHAPVWYEYEHVQRESPKGLQPHRVCVRADNLLCGHNNASMIHKRLVPQNPLGPAAPSGLHFSAYFFEAVGLNKADGIAFQGVAMPGQHGDHPVPIGNLNWISGIC